jgi:FAD-dependent urate hydroxylase
MSDVEITIIGAGPYGLSVASHLKQAGLPFRILGSPLETWRSFMPRGMILKSERFASNLWDPGRNYTLSRYSAEKDIPYQPYGDPLSLADFLRYADWFRGHAVSDVTDVKVDRIEVAHQGYALYLADGTTLKTRQVVVATGFMAFQSSPPELSGVPEPLCLHSARLHDLGGFAGRDVTILGAGQSALETAALMHEAGARVRLLVRKDALRWNDPPHETRRSVADRIRDPEAGLGSGWQSLAVSELPRLFRLLFPAEKRHRFVASSWGPSGAYWLRARTEGKVELLASHRLRAADVQDGRVRLTVEGPGSPREILTDHVVAATGFKVDLDRMGILSPGLKAGLVREGACAPALDSSFETSSPGLFMVGVASAPTFGPVMRFMFGAKHAAPIVTRRLKWRYRARGWTG